MEDYQEKMNGFKKRVNDANLSNQMQEVRQLVIKQQKEVQLNVWIPKEMLQSLKLKSVHENKSIKQLVQQAIEKSLQIVP